jgi:hypothetical protein
MNRPDLKKFGLITYEQTLFPKLAFLTTFINNK